VVLEQSQQAEFLTSWILDSSGRWIPDSMSWIPDSKAVDFGFHRLKIVWIPDSGLPNMGRRQFSYFVRKSRIWLFAVSEYFP